MLLPKFLLGDHMDFQDHIFVIHTEYPRFIINLVNDEVYWMEELTSENEEDLALEMANLVEEAGLFYDAQITQIESEEKN